MSIERLIKEEEKDRARRRQGNNKTGQEEDRARAEIFNLKTACIHINN